MRTTAQASAIAIIASLALSASAQAEEIGVTRGDDPVPDACLPADCSLREAVIAASGDADKDTIALHAGTHYELTLGDLQAGPAATDEDDGLTGDLDVTRGDLRISAPVADPATIDANGFDRALEVRADSSAISGLIVTGGSTEGAGGGIRVGPDAKLRISRSTLLRNAAAESGGALEVEGVAKLKDSTFSQSYAGTKGGGISVSASGRLSAINSTLAGNEAAAAGGGLNALGAAELNAVTIARNSVTGPAGSAGGGGIAAATGRRVVVENSLIARNKGPLGADDCGPEPLDSDGDNLTSTPCAGVDFAGDEVAANPRIKRLRDNGGPTKTIGLKPKSAAIDAAGPQSSPRRDQRGVRRSKLPDIGAYERETKTQEPEGR